MLHSAVEIKQFSINVHVQYLCQKNAQLIWYTQNTPKSYKGLVDIHAPIEQLQLWTARQILPSYPFNMPSH